MKSLVEFEQISDPKALELIDSLRAENEKLARINQVLIQRVDMGIGNQSAAYQSFENAVHLTEKVKLRTQKLQSALESLEQSNLALEAARKDSDAAQQRIVDAIESFSDAFILFDANDTMHLANGQFYRLWDALAKTAEVGVTSLAEIHAVTKEFEHESAANIEAQTQLQAPEAGQIFRIPDGRWLRVFERPTADGGLVIVFNDITAIKENELRIREQALEEKSQILQSTLDNLSQGVALVNTDGYLDAWNERFTTLIGKSVDTNAERLTFKSLISDSEVELSGTAQKRRDFLLQEKTTKTGRVIEIRQHRVPHGGYVNTYTDVTERSRNEAALSESEQKMRLITDAMPALISYIRNDYCYDFVNKAFSVWFGMDRESIIDHAMASVVGEREYVKHEPFLASAMSGKVVNFETEQTIPNKGLIVSQKTYVPHFNAQREVVGVFALEQDVTKQRRTSQALNNAYQTLETRVQERTKELRDLNTQLEREIAERASIEADLISAKRSAEEANISKTKFMASVSHDLLQPMNAAKLFLSALNETNQTGKVGELIDSLKFSLLNMESLLNSLVNISKLDSGVIEASHNSFCVNDLLENLANESAPKATSAGVRFRYVTCRAVIRSDSQLLARILRNLLSNAFRYLEEGEILLGCRRRPEGVEIQVIDTGVGIPESMFEEIFQEFKRGTAPRRQDRGLGLGLAIVQKIALVLGHTVKVASKVGKGSIFSVMVPYGNRNLAVNRKVEKVETKTGGLFLQQKVLVVDNDESICNGMEKLLSLWGCRVSTALSLEQLQAEPELIPADLNLLIVDYHLDDDRTGIEVLEYVRSIRKVPVIMITAIYSQELRREMKLIGHYLLNKPVKPLKLKSIMMHLLPQHSAH